MIILHLEQTALYLPFFPSAPLMRLPQPAQYQEEIFHWFWLGILTPLVLSPSNRTIVLLQNDYTMPQPKCKRLFRNQFLLSHNCDNKAFKGLFGLHFSVVPAPLEKEQASCFGGKAHLPGDILEPCCNPIMCKLPFFCVY